jgi:hypothetical protein
MIRKMQEDPILVSVNKIWDHAQHNAFTDLVRFQNHWFVCFRESNEHELGENGKIRVLASSDGVIWTSVHLLEVHGMDLRDPKLSVTPEKKLMLLTGGVVTKNQRYLCKQTYVSFSDDGAVWGSLLPILEPHDWLWRITWHLGKAFGCAYSFANREEEWSLALYESTNGIHFEKIVDLNIRGFPSETTLQFTMDGEMVALVRREAKQDRMSCIGRSWPPFREWQWSVAKHHLGGPNFIILPSNKMWASGRIISTTPYGMVEKTVLARMTMEDITPTLVLPSGGDTSYPGMVYHKGYLWMSYYSSHEGKSCIYFAKLQLPSN